MTDANLRILVVEDEMLVAMLIEDMLTDLGHEMVGHAPKLATALEMAAEEAFDCAILDVNLNDRKSFPVADLLRERGIPFLFATGYGRKGLEGAYEDILVLQKPFEAEHLQRAFTEVLGRDPRP